MVLQTHAAALDAAAAIGIVASGAASAAVLLEYLPMAAAVFSILVSIAAGAWYAVQLYDRFTDPK
jgi:hypothetical protein